MPSIIIFSGRGLQIKWFLNTVLPKNALPRWDACQRVLINLLSNIGSDPMARDASRVLRLVGTINTKSSKRCRVLHVNFDENKKILWYSFDYTAEKILPFSRKFIEEQKKLEQLKIETELTKIETLFDEIYSKIKNELQTIINNSIIETSQLQRVLIKIFLKFKNYGTN